MNGIVIRTENIIESFSKFCINNELDGIENDTVRSIDNKSDLHKMHTDDTEDIYYDVPITYK